jgi:hypothetical protein
LFLGNAYDDGQGCAKEKESYMSLSKLATPGILLLMSWLVPMPTNANAFCDTTFRKHCSMVGSMPSPSHCDIAGVHDPDCIIRLRFNIWVSVKNNPGFRKTVEEENAAMGPGLRPSPFGGSTVPIFGEPNKQGANK